MELQLKIKESFLQKFFRMTLQKGPIPRHVAFVLDGNRRYAKERNMETIAGHRKGSDTFDELVDFAMLCGVKEVTAYVFSINNFNRTAQEVNGIMALLREKLEYKLQHPEKLTGRCYRVVGKRDLFPEDLKPVMSKLMMMTKNNTKVVVNIAFAYTGRDEIVSGVNTLVEGIRNNELALNSITESLFEQSFHSFPVSPVDLFVRTGECRLSDFLTWESNDEAVLTFIDDYWPKFSYWKFLFAIFYFQTNIPSVSYQVTGSDYDAFKTRYLEEQSQNLNEFVRKKRQSEWNVVEQHAKSFGMDARVSASGG